MIRGKPLKLKVLLIFFMIAVLAPPANYHLILPGSKSIVNSLQIMALAYSYIKIIGIIKRLNLTYVLIFTYMMVVYVYSWIFRESKDYTTPVVCIALLNLLIYYYLTDRLSLYKACSYYYELMLILLFIVQMLFPDKFSEYDYWCFGNSNFVVRFFLPGSVFVMLHEYEKKNKVYTTRSMIYLVLFSYLIIIINSSTGIIGLVAFYVFSIIIYKENIPKFASIWYMNIYTIVAFVSMYLFKIQEKFDYLIVVILGKDLSLTGRTRVWDAAIEYIKPNLMSGLGVKSEGYSMYLGNAHAHQYWLNSLLMSGIIGTSILLLVYWSVSIKTMSNKHLVEVRVCISFIVSFLIMGIDESLINAPMLLPVLGFTSMLGYEKESNPIKTHNSVILNATPHRFRLFKRKIRFSR